MGFINVSPETDPHRAAEAADTNFGAKSTQWNNILRAMHGDAIVWVIIFRRGGVLPLPLAACLLAEPRVA
jgi:hypothetical protein